MEKVEIILSHPYGDHAVGDRLELETDEARRLVHGGIGRYATKSDAREAGADAQDPTVTVTAKR